MKNAENAKNLWLIIIICFRLEPEKHLNKYVKHKHIKKTKRFKPEMVSLNTTKTLLRSIKN